VIDETYTAGVLQELVRINSVNPSLSPDGVGEAAIGRYTADAMRQLGLEVASHEPRPGRVSVVGRLKGTGGGRTLMLNAHYDTVAVDEMTDPFGATIAQGRLYGRGAYDMKGSLAACFGAVKALRESGARLRGDVVIAAVADEEHASLGTSDIIERYRVDGAVVTEPTSLAVCLAHKGFAWISVTVEGRAAHGSQFALGVDANVRLGPVLVRLGQLASELTARSPHPLVGAPSLHVAMIEGGTGMSTYAASATAHIERRMVPGETVDHVVAEIRQRVGDLGATITAGLAREPFEVEPDRPIVRAVVDATAEVVGTPPRLVGENPWMDSALLAAAGVETVVFGPHGAGAHAKEEWVDLQSVYQTARILAETARSYCGLAG
jgi:acetylornithine deacetylase